MSVTAGVSDTIITIRDKLRGKIGQTKVKRYWPGKAPEWADDADEDGDIRMARAVALEKAFPIQEDSDIVRRDDPRLRQEENRRQEGLDLEEEDEDAMEEKRRRLREKLLQRQQEEAALLPEEEEEEEVEDEEEEESEYETDSEDELQRVEAEERALEELLKKRLQERKVETKQIVVEEIRKDQEIQKNLELEADTGDVDTDDELNEAEEYEAWKAREIAR
ncbi:hypothetical protein C3L33_16508, partial [Rhododendron williamsianum]